MMALRTAIVLNSVNIVEVARQCHSFRFWVNGGDDDDIVIGGTTFHDNNDAALQAIVRSVPARIRRDTELGFEATRRDWLARAARRNEPLTARLANETVTGIFRDIDPSGALVLETATGMRKVTAGDVFFPEVTECC